MNTASATLAICVAVFGAVALVQLQPPAIVGAIAVLVVWMWATRN